MPKNVASTFHNFCQWKIKKEWFQTSWDVLYRGKDSIELWLLSYLPLSHIKWTHVLHELIICSILNWFKKYRRAFYNNVVSYRLLWNCQCLSLVSVFLFFCGLFYSLVMFEFVLLSLIVAEAGCFNHLPSTFSRPVFSNYSTPKSYHVPPDNCRSTP